MTAIRHWKRWAGLFVLGLLTMPIAAQTSAPVRVALVTLARGEMALGVVDLATAGLSAEAGVEVLEREEIDRLFAEQERSRMQAGDEALALRAGQVLAADVLGVVEFNESASDALGLVVFDAGTSARLWDATLPAGLGESVDMIVFGMRRALMKRSAEGGGGNATVCVLTIRNEDLPDENGPVLEGIGRLVERKLTSSERLSVLERQRLGVLNEERRSSGKITPLPGAMTLAELSFRQGEGSEGVVASIRLTDVDGAVLREQRFPARNVDGGMAGEMSEWMCRALEGGCISPMASPEREAEQFLRESVFWFGYYPAHVGKALCAAEAAHALDPASPAIREQLVACLLQSQVPWELRMRYWGRALDLQDSLLREGYYREVDRSRLIGASGAHCRYECHMWQILKQAVSEAKGYSAFRAALADICQRHRATMKEINRHRLATIKSAQTFNRYVQWYNFYISKTHEIWALSGEDWTDDTLELIGPILEMAREYPLYGSRDFEVNRVFLRLTTKTRQFDREPEESSLWRLEEPEMCRLKGLLGQMAEHPNSLIAIYGHLGVLMTEWRLGKLSEADFQARFVKVRDFGLAAIDASREDGSTPATRAMLYQAMLDVMDSLPDLKMRRREQQALFDFMIDHGEFVHTVEGTVTNPDVGPFAVYARISDSLPFGRTQSGATISRETMLFNMHRALDALADPEVTVLRGSRNIAQSSLQARVMAMGGLPAGSGPSPWGEARPLLGRNDGAGFRALSRAIYRDGDIYVAELQEVPASSLLTVKRISLPSGEIEKVGSASVKEPKRLLYSGRRLHAVALDERYFYLGTSTAGIFAFPLEGGDMRRFSTENGLPADSVQSLAAVGERLFAGLGEWGQATYFVEIDMASGAVALRGSSLRRTIESPIDNASPQPFFGDMHVDMERNRLYFLLHVGRIVLPNEFRGLWSLDLETGDYVQQARFTRNLQSISAQPDGTLCLMDGSTIVRYHPEGDRVQLVYTVRRDPPVGPGLTLGAAEVKERYWMIAPFAIENETIWSGRPFSRLQIQESRHEVLTPPAPDLNRVTGDWHSFNYLQEEHALLVSMTDKIWLLKLTPAGSAIHENEQKVVP